MSYRTHDDSGNDIDSKDTYAIVHRTTQAVIGMFTELPQKYYDEMLGERLNWSITSEVFDFQRDAMVTPTEARLLNYRF